MATNSFKWYNPISWFDAKTSVEWKVPEPKKDPTANWNLTYTNVQSISFTGEKNPGGAGPMLDYKLGYNELRIRSWQAMLESDLAQIGMNKLVTWVIGKGLKLQSEPQVEVLKEEGITLDKKKFTKSFESRFGVWKKSKTIDYAGQKNLNELSIEAERNAVVGGDVLVVLRVIKGELKIQLIDGENVQSPFYGSEWYPKFLPNGHSIVDGVEMNANREHLAYWVKVYAVEATQENIYQYRFERIDAIGKKSGLKMAYLYYGSQYRINNVRGMPLLSACFEKLNNLDLYSGATLKQAQEAAKVDYQVIHHKDANPLTPFASSTVSAQNGQGTGTNNILPQTADGETIGKTTHITGIGTAWNNAPGSEVKVMENKNPLYFKEFFDTHSNIFFAVLQMPPNVAMGKYDDSYSASRAAIKDFEHILGVKREHHHVNFLNPIVSLFLDLQVLTNKIQAPGYIFARSRKNAIVIDCYKNVRFVGPQVPGIDPVAEVEAVRLMLGARANNLPLCDLENAVEILGGGDAVEIVEQFSTELKYAEGLGIKTEPVLQQVTNGKEKVKPDKKKKV